MEETKGSLNIRRLNIISILLAVLGAAFYWWVPMGIVLCIGGLAFGFVDWVNARRRSLNYRLSIVAMFLCLAALTFDIVIALLGLQTITLGRQ